MSQLRTSYAAPPPSVYTPPAQAPAKKAAPEDGFRRGPNGEVFARKPNEGAVASQSWDLAPGTNAEEDARLNKEYLDQQKARQKSLAGSAASSLLSFQTAGATRPDLASRLLKGL